MFLVGLFQPPHTQKVDASLTSCQYLSADVCCWIWPVPFWEVVHSVDLDGHLNEPCFLLVLSLCICTWSITCCGANENQNSP